jgi:hypothetical protein
VTDAPPAYTVKVQQDVLTVRMVGVAVGWEQWFFLSSDWHWDNPKCDRLTLRRHLNMAKERRAGVFVFGDLFCAMQGKFDKRANKSDMRPEHREGNYLDLLVSTGADWLREWIDNLVEIAPGNHETAILNHHETDLTQRLVDRLNGPLAKGEAGAVHRGGYAGFVRFMFQREPEGNRTSRLLYYTHGSGGNAPVSRGAMDAARKAEIIPDADVVYRGHNHNSWILPWGRQRVTDGGKKYIDEQLHVNGGTYKSDFNLDGGYAIERGFLPLAMGGAWLRFYHDSTKLGNVGMEATLAR